MTLLHTSWYEAMSLGVSILTLFVLWLTLRAVKAYTREAKRLADVAVEQMACPFVTVFREPDLSEGATLEGCVLSISETPTIKFKNDGTAPAVKFRYRIGGPGASREGTPEMLTIEAGGVLDSRHPRNALDDRSEIFFEYESLGGARYKGKGVIEDRRWVKDLTVERQ